MPISCKSETITCRFCGFAFDGTWERTNQARVCVRCGKDNGMATEAVEPRRRKKPMTNVDEVSAAITRAARKISKAKRRPPAPLSERHGTGVFDPETKNGFYQKLILEGKTREEIRKAVTKKFPDEIERFRLDIAWNIWHLRKVGKLEDTREKKPAPRKRAKRRTKRSN